MYPMVNLKFLPQGGVFTVCIAEDPARRVVLTDRPPTDHAGLVGLAARVTGLREKDVRGEGVRLVGDQGRVLAEYPAAN